MDSKSRISCLKLVDHAQKSCLALYMTLLGFQTHPKGVCDFIEELAALIGVLEFLNDITRHQTHSNLTALELPLQQCDSGCHTFLQELQECCSRSSVEQKYFKGWTKLRCLGDTIDDFKYWLAAYKSAIEVVLVYIKV